MTTTLTRRSTLGAIATAAAAAAVSCGTLVRALDHDGPALERMSVVGQAFPQVKPPTPTRAAIDSETWASLDRLPTGPAPLDALEAARTVAHHLRYLRPAGADGLTANQMHETVVAAVFDLAWGHTTRDFDVAWHQMQAELRARGLARDGAPDDEPVTEALLDLNEHFTNAVYGALEYGARFGAALALEARGSSTGIEALAAVIDRAHARAMVA